MRWTIWNIFSPYVYFFVGSNNTVRQEGKSWLLGFILLPPPLIRAVNLWSQRPFFNPLLSLPPQPLWLRRQGKVRLSTTLSRKKNYKFEDIWIETKVDLVCGQLDVSNYWWNLAGNRARRSGKSVALLHAYLCPKTFFFCFPAHWSFP